MKKVTLLIVMLAFMANISMAQNKERVNAFNYSKNAQGYINTAEQFNKQNRAEKAKKQMDFAVETTLATRTLLKTVKLAQAAGYTVTLLYFWLNSPELAIERVRARVEAGGHDIPEETIRRRYNVGIYYFFQYYAPLCERWILADNSQIPFRVIAEGSKKDVINIKDESTYTKIRSIAEERHRQVEETGEILSL